MSAEFVSAGVASAVHDGDRELVGHVLLLDYDDVPASVVADDAARLDGPVVVVRSSVGSWHVWALSLRSWQEAVDDARETSACQHFVDSMVDKGRFVLRTQPKFSVDGEIRRSAPAPDSVIGDVSAPVSQPHAIRLRQMADDAGLDDVADELRQIGTSDHAVGRTFPTHDFHYSETQGGADE